MSDAVIQVEQLPKRKRREKNVTNPKMDWYIEEEMEFYRHLDPALRNNVGKQEQDIQDINKESVPTRFKILLSDIDIKAKAIAIKKLDYLYNLDPSSNEYYKTMHWIDSVCKLPINKYKSLAVNYGSPKDKVKDFLITARKNMDTVVYGHKDAKEQIIRLLAQWIVNPSSKGMVIGIHGPMGCGKTTLIKDSICSVLGLPFAFIPLGGANDSCYLEGHSYTYEGAIGGKLWMYL